MANLQERIQRGETFTEQEKQRIAGALIARIMGREGAPAALAPELIETGENTQLQFLKGAQPLEFMAPEELLESYREQTPADGRAALQNSRLFSAGLIIYWLYYGNFYDGPGRRITGLPAAGSAKAAGSLITVADCPGNPFAEAVEALTKYRGSRAEGAAMIQRLTGAEMQRTRETGRYLCLSIDGRDNNKVPLFAAGAQEYRKTVHGVRGIRELKLWTTDKNGRSAVLTGRVAWPYPPEEQHDVVIGCNARGTVCRVSIADHPSAKWEFPVN